MGFLDTIFGSKPSDDTSSLQWNSLTELSQLDAIVKVSNTKTQVIFKHSIRCGISSAVLKQFKKKTIEDSVDLHLLDLINYRALSNEIASKFNIIHQSPQLLIIKSGKVTKHDSHYDLLNLEIE